MRVVIAPDKFRGSLSAEAAAQAIARGVRTADLGATCDLVPMADGGEGTLDALVAATGGAIHTVEVVGPLGNPVRARWGLLGGGRTAVVEMAEASGHAHVPPDRRNPTRATTLGTGQLIRLALESGVEHLIVAIGGSATNDGGAGMAQALGFRLLDQEGREIGPGGWGLADLDRIDPTLALPALRSVRVEVASDVRNPLCGPDGASRVFGPQKGATPGEIETLDRNLARLADVIRRDLGLDVLAIPGGGAAGGLGAGLVAFAGAELRPGAGLVVEAVGLTDRLRGADLCLTGEGRLDASTASGKTVAGVAAAARGLGVPTVALAGSVADRPEGSLAAELGLAAALGICPGPATLDEAIARADDWLARSAEGVVRVFLAGRSGQGDSGAGGLIP